MKKKIYYATVINGTRESVYQAYAKSFMSVVDYLFACLKHFYKGRGYELFARPKRQYA